MKLSSNFLTENACYKSGKRHVVQGIMVHSTGANNPWLRRYVAPDDGIIGINTGGTHWNTEKPGGISVCVHAFIGKDKNGGVRTCQTLPWNMVGWHSGSGTRSKSANNTGYIGFEICEDDLTDAAYFSAVYQEAVELCAYLCREYRLNPLTDILCHSEGYAKGIASNHADVMHWFPKHGKNMDLFRAQVQSLMTKAPAPLPDSSAYKTIIQTRCQFTNPNQVFTHLDGFKYATDLYRKWAESYR
ncbi:MAG: peptidoglycan recognition family protein [Evtepia sp.]